VFELAHLVWDIDRKLSVTEATENQLCHCGRLTSRMESLNRRL
jgi:hypothetical protein